MNLTAAGDNPLIKNDEIRILFLDDTPEFYTLVKEKLQVENYHFNFYHTDNEFQFIELLKNIKPTIIISELFSENYDSKKALDHVKMRYPEIPFILVTAQMCNESALHYLQLGAADFLQKEQTEMLPMVIYKALRHKNEKTTIKKAKKLRWEDAQRFKGLIEHSQEPVITYTESGVVTYASPAIEKILGYTVEEFVGTNVRDHIHPEDLNTREEKFQDLLNKKEKYFTIEEERLIHKEGFTIWVKAIISDARFTPGILGFMTNFRDITENKFHKLKLEKTLKDLTDYKIALEESSIVGMIDNEGKISYVNDAFCKVSKYKEEELIGSDHSLLDSQFHSNTFFLKIWKTITNGKIWKGEIKKTAKDGSHYWVNTTIVPLLNANGKPYQYIVVMREITERIQRTEELHKSVELLTNQNKRLLNFSYIVSHNLRSHTTNMQSIVDYMEDIDDEVERKEMLQNLKEVSEALNETLFHLNEIVHIQSTEGIKIEEIHLKQFIIKSLEVFKPLLKEIYAEVEINIPDDIKVNFATSYFESIFYNLLWNAIKYKHPERQLKITLDAEQKGNFSVICITDNGIGINLEKNREKIFGMYKTFHGNKDARGLGLFMCKNQIEALGGKIEVESKLGEGTTFKVFVK